VAKPLTLPDGGTLYEVLEVTVECDDDQAASVSEDGDGEVGCSWGEYVLNERAGMTMFSEYVSYDRGDALVEQKVNRHAVL
jgi:hypothetical protein